MQQKRLTLPEGRIGEVRLRVRYAETDQMGVVYHANYLVWMELGRVEYFRAEGFRYRDMEADGILLAVTEVECRYAAPARYDDEVLVRTGILQSASRMIRFGYRIENAENGALFAEGQTRHIFVDRQMKLVRLPEKYYASFGITSRQL